MIIKRLEWLRSLESELQIKTIRNQYKEWLEELLELDLSEQERSMIEAAAKTALSRKDIPLGGANWGGLYNPIDSARQVTSADRHWNTNA